MRMRGAIPLLPLHAFMASIGASLALYRPIYIYVYIYIYIYIYIYTAEFMQNYETIVVTNTKIKRGHFKL
jgi:hypothetical protein